MTLQKNHRRELSVFDKHRRKIALQTLRYSDIGASIMGGMSKDEARDFLRSIGERIPSDSES